MLKVSIAWERKPEVAAEGPSKWNLTDLTPGYIETEHGVYVDALVEALSNDDLLNIALSGTYGVGKSSILKRVAERERRRVVELSLSTLAPLQPGKIDEAVPLQATTPTNRIQQEIVKQLLYRVPPRKSPASRFQRIERSGWVRQLGVSALAGLLASVVFLITGWATTLASVLGELWSPGLLIYPLLFVVVTAAFFAVGRLLHGRIRIKQLSAGSATVTLDDKSVSYFDQYLDEIVYFFESTGKSVVIFEDIDRFDDAHIFETLRSLNTLLNKSPQIRPKIHFVYAIKDSIFDQFGLENRPAGPAAPGSASTDSAHAEIVRTNRTKFFDLVIPVVPFITHLSARNLSAKVLADLAHEVSPELTDLASRYVPDMRLLKNARNEFIVFRDRVFSGSGARLGLSETNLFAMMLFKGTHLSDFENIRLGRSNIDDLYSLSRELISENISRLDSEVRSTRRSITSAKDAQGRARRQGAKLLDHIDWLRRVAAFAQEGTLSLAGVQKTRADLTMPSFWAELSAAPESAELTWQIPGYRPSLTLTRNDLRNLLGPSADVGGWREYDSEQLEDDLVLKLEQLAFLRGADMHDLMSRPEFKVGKNDESLDDAAERLLSGGLAYQLVRAGYIDRNFTLYTSTFHGDRVSPAATSFIIHHVDKALMDPQYELTAADVDDIVRERGAIAMRDSAFLNIDIMDRVLRTNASATDAMMTGVTRFDDDATKFLFAYMSSGKERELFVEVLAGRYAGVLPFLVGEVEVDDEMRIALVSSALRGLGGRPASTVDDETASFLREHYAQLPTLRKEGRVTASIRIARVFEQAGVRVSALALLSEQVREAFISRNLYAITRENLGDVLGAGRSLALDSIRAANQGVYEYVMQDLPAYLSALGEDLPTNDDEAGFGKTIQDTLASHPDLVEAVIQRASTSSRVQSLAKVPREAWSALARHRRFNASFGNVSAYLADSPVVDADLAEVLKADRRIRTGEQRDQSERLRVAHVVLASGEVLGATMRAKLVESLKLADYLDVEQIAPESSPLFPHLLELDLIADDADSYARLVGTDWATRERWLRVSTHAYELVTPQFVGDDLPTLMESKDIDDSAKLAVIANAESFAVGASEASLIELGRFAAREDCELPLSVISMLAAVQGVSELVVALLKPHLATIDLVALRQVLVTLGGKYDQLTRVGADTPTFTRYPALVSLLDELRRRGIVASFDRDSSEIRVYKRRKFNGE